MRLSFRFHRGLAFGGAFMATGLLTGVSHAQPDAGPRGAFAPPPRPITLDELHQIAGGPTLVTLNKKNVTIPELSRLLVPHYQPPTPETLARLTKDAPAKEPRTSVDIDWKQLPYWKAMSESEKLTGMHWQPYYFEYGLLPIAYNGFTDTDARVALENPFFKVLAHSLSHKEERLALMKPGRDAPRLGMNSTYLTMLLEVDPKLRVASYELRITQARTAAGQVLTLPTDLRAGTGLSLGGDLIDGLAILPQTLPWSLSSGTVLSHLQGTLRVVLITASSTWRIPDVQAAPRFSRVVGDREITLLGFETVGGGLVLQKHTKVVQGAPGGPEVLGGPQLRDSQGNALFQHGISTSFNSVLDGAAGPAIQLQYGPKNPNVKLQGPFSLEWEFPTETRTFEAPFELRDIVIP